MYRALLTHLFRGGLAAALLAWAVPNWSAHPGLALASIAAAVIAMKGCPMCWALGLLETIFKIPKFRGFFTCMALLAATTLIADTPVDRWAAAVGGREKVAAITSLYREATIEVRGFTGSIKAWRTAEGKYRKEEQIATFSTIETFDGTHATLQQGTAPPRRLAGADLARARSTAYANFNAVFFAFFPERRRGTLDIEGDDTIVLRPEGGIDWRVTLDPQTSLPKTMVHMEGERTIAVTFVSYEMIDGIKFEKEIHRTTGNPRFDSVIRFTKTIVNGPIDPSLFATSELRNLGTF